jgi:replication factor C subunit 2/4
LRYKIAILDEADLLTNDAQHALRRIVEDNSTRTRFCIICNYVTKIIEPLASRCVRFRFNPISAEAQVEKLTQISESEGVTTSKYILAQLIELTQGDLRRSITLLQTASALHNRDLRAVNINDMGGAIPKEFIGRIMSNIRELSPKELIEEADRLISEGYSPEMFLIQFQNLVLFEKPLRFTEMQAAKILEVIASTERNLILGGSDALQLCNLLVACHSILTL